MATRPENSLQFDGLVFAAAEEREHEIDDLETQNQVRNLLNSQLERFDDDDEDDYDDEGRYHDNDDDDEDYHNAVDDNRGTWSNSVSDFSNQQSNDADQYDAYHNYSNDQVHEPIITEKQRYSNDHFIAASDRHQEVEDFDSYGQEVVVGSPSVKSPYLMTERAALNNYNTASDVLRDTAHDYYNTQGGENSTLLDQLKVLYEARGHQIDELTAKLSSLQQQSSRAARVSEHKVHLVQEEKAEVVQKLQLTEQKLETEKKQKRDIEDQMESLKHQLTDLQSDKQELLQKLSEAENSIGDLNLRVKGLLSARSESSEKRDMEMLMKSREEKYNNDILQWKEKCDSISVELESKKEQIAVLKYQLSQVKDGAHSVGSDQLSYSNSSPLQERSEELKNMKIRLEDAIASKSITEDINTSLQAEIKDLKEQIVMYETATRYGISTVSRSADLLADKYNNTDLLNDSYSQLGIKTANQSSDEVSRSLKAELERCLQIYRNKRQQVSLLTEELKHTKSQLLEAKAQLELYRAAAEREQRNQMSDSSLRMDSRNQSLVACSTKRVHFGDSDSFDPLYDSRNENFLHSYNIAEKPQADAIVIPLQDLQKLGSVASMVENEVNIMMSSNVSSVNIYSSTSENEMINRYAEVIKRLETKSVIRSELGNTLASVLFCLRQLWIKHDLPQEYKKWEETVLPGKYSEWKKLIIDEEQKRWENCVLPEERSRWEQLILAQEKIKWEQVVLPQEQALWESRMESILRTKYNNEVLPVEKEKWKIEILPQIRSEVLEEVLPEEQKKWREEILPQERSKWEHEVLPQHRVRWEQVIMSRESSKLEQETLPNLRAKWTEEIIPQERARWEREVLPEELRKWKNTVSPRDCAKWEEELLKEKNKWESSVVSQERVKYETEMLPKEKVKWTEEIVRQEKIRFENEVLPRERQKWEENILSAERERWEKELEEREILRSRAEKPSEECRKCLEMKSLAAQQLTEHHEILQRNGSGKVELNDEALSALQEIKNKYLHTVRLIKDEVLKHASDTNKRNAEMMKQRLLHERQTTARYMRNHYIKCLTQFLDRQFDSAFRDRMLSAMEKLLDNMPERDCNYVPFPLSNHS